MQEAQREQSKEERRRLGHEVRERTLTYIVVAFSLIASLAWNEAIKSPIDYFVPFGANSIWAKLLYAVFITIMVVFITIYLEKWLRRHNS